MLAFVRKDILIKFMTEFSSFRRCEDERFEVSYWVK